MRAVATYDDTDYEWLYRRQDVEEGYPQTAFDRTFDNYRRIAPIGLDQERAMDVGDLRANVTVYDRAVVIQFALTETEGMIVSLDAEVGEDMVEVIATGLQLIVADRDEGTTAMPGWVEERGA